MRMEGAPGASFLFQDTPRPGACRKTPVGVHNGSPSPDSTGSWSFVTSVSTTAFHLPERLAAKADPALIGEDDARLVAVADTINAQLASLEHRLDAALKAPARSGQERVDKDDEVRLLTQQLRVLSRFGMDLCLGTFTTETGDKLYIGRLGLVDSDGERLLVDWRTPAAEAFFAATHAHPMGLASRRRFRWSQGRIVDYWDEAFIEAASHGSSVDDDSAFIASLSGARGTRMRDVLGTIAADQDAIIRADSAGALIVDGGPGTGKTVVALHRTAYLLYADARLRDRAGGVLFVGPHAPYMAYIDDVLPSLGEDGVNTATLIDMVPEGADAARETDERVEALKQSVRMASVVEPLLAHVERAPRRPLIVETEWADIEVLPFHWEEAFGAVELGTTHNEARDQVWQTLIQILLDRYSGRNLPRAVLQRELVQSPELREAFDQAWPVIDATSVVAQLWSDPVLLANVAPWLNEGEVALLQRDDPRAWTTADLPLIDALRLRLGDPRSGEIARERSRTLEADRATMDRVVETLLETEEFDDGEGVFSMLAVADLRSTLVDEDAAPALETDPLEGPFAHVVVDEAQELTDAQWQMLLRRCPSRSFTIVGDRAQARAGFTESWQERLNRIGIRTVTERHLTVNYRTPAEIMAVAEPVIRAAIADANVPSSVRESGIPVEYGDRASLASALDAWLAANPDGVACVIGDASFEPTERVRSLTPSLAKGLEFDFVVLVDPDSFGADDPAGVAGAVDRYVAMTRATSRLLILN